MAPRPRRGGALAAAVAAALSLACASCGLPGSLRERGAATAAGAPQRSRRGAWPRGALFASAAAPPDRGTWRGRRGLARTCGPRGRTALFAVERCDGIEGIDAAIAGTGEGGPVLVLSFSTSWCGPCKLMDPKVDQLTEDFAGKARFIKVLGDKDPDGLKILQREGVKSVPQYHIFKGGEKVQQVLGAKYDDLVEALKTHATPGDS